MVTFVICDDDKDFAQSLSKTILQEYRRYRGTEEEVRCICYTTAQDALENSPQDSADVYFLDIELGDMLGFEVARRLAKTVDDAGIVYVTNHESYITQAFVGRPLGFVRKDNLAMDIRMPMMAVMEFLDKNHRVFTFLDNAKKVRISLHTILYVEIFNHYLEIVQKNTAVKVRDKLSRVERELCRNGFVKISRSCLVNLYYIRSVKKEKVILYNRKVLYASAGRTEHVFNEWQRYLMHHG